MNFLHDRSAAPEIMDDLVCDGPVVYQTLKELEIINRLLGGNQVTLSGLKALLRDRPKKQHITLVDLGCGRGDMLEVIKSWGKINGVEFSLTGIDANPNIVLFAKKKLGDDTPIQIQVHDVFSEEFRNQNFDIFVATLFLHHFTDDQLVDMFQWLHRRAKIGIVINDIHRHWLAYYSIRFLTRIFSRSPMVKYDAPLSVRRAFRQKELENLLKGAGVTNYTLKWKWAFRWQLVIRA